MDNIIRLTPQNKELLRRVLQRGMRGSYYERDETPDGADISLYLRQELDEMSKERAEQIAAYYCLSGTDLLEIISDEQECEEWLERRAYPWDDPW